MFLNFNVYHSKKNIKNVCNLVNIINKFKNFKKNIGKMVFFFFFLKKICSINVYHGNSVFCVVYSTFDFFWGFLFYHFLKAIIYFVQRKLGENDVVFLAAFECWKTTATSVLTLIPAVTVSR